MSSGRTVALVDDLMDRSRLRNALPDCEFVRDPADCGDAETVLVDLARHGDAMIALRKAAPTSRIVAFGPHGDRDAATRARAEGADVVVARSRFFRDPAGTIG